MKLLRCFFTTLFLCLILSSSGQESPVVSQRTPEQEAARQTEKLQQELDLTQEQVKQVYEINLKYARERQVSNRRSEAMERMKSKNEDLKGVLSEEQFEQLQNKRYERSSFEIPKQSNPQNTESKEAVDKNAENQDNNTGKNVQNRPVRTPAEYKRTLESTRNSEDRGSNVRNTTRPSVEKNTSTQSRTNTSRSAGNQQEVDRTNRATPANTSRPSEPTRSSGNSRQASTSAGSSSSSGTGTSTTRR